MKPAPCIGGLTPFSTVDWPGTLCAVVFIAGCPWRCHYCHNPALQQRHAAISWDAVQDFLHRRRGLLDGVVFSGGEPLTESKLPAMIDAARALGYRIGLHTAGIYPQRLQALLPQLDWVGLDVKTLPAAYTALTGRRRSAAPVAASLQHLLAWGGDFECRTTWSRDWLAEDELLDLAQTLAAQGVQKYAVQGYRSTPDQVAESPGVATHDVLRHLFPDYQWR